MASEPSDLSFGPDGRRHCRRCFALLQIAEADARAKLVGASAPGRPLRVGRVVLFVAVVLPVATLFAFGAVFALVLWRAVRRMD